MAPTSSIRSSEEETSTASSSVAAAAPTTSGSSSRDSSSSPPLTAEDLDSEPFYGMFDRHSDDDDDEESAWAQIRLPLPVSPRASIPEASETFQRAMRQLDGIEDAPGRKAVACGKASEGSSGCGSEKRERKKSGQVVRKAASFSAPDTQSSSSSSSSSCMTSSSSKGDLAAEVRRRRSMPCMSPGKRVQWADEAGVAELVSVRLIRPRLQAKGGGEKEEGAAPFTPRSILRRLTGIH